MLVAISIPIFTAQLEKARQSTDLANLRASYAEAATASLEKDGGAADGSTVTINHSDTGFTKFTDAKVGEVAVSSDAVLSASTKGDKIHASIDASGKPKFVKE